MVGPGWAVQLAGKDVIVAPTSASFQYSLFLPGPDMVPGVFLHVVGAETLKRGTPVDIGWAPAFALAIATLLLTLTTRLQRWFTAIAIAPALLLITAKVVLAGMLVTSSIGPALCLKIGRAHV